MSAVPSVASTAFQRLEFLGDRVLGLAVADILVHAIPTPRKASFRDAWPRSCGARAARLSPAHGMSRNSCGLALASGVRAALSRRRFCRMSASRSSRPCISTRASVRRAPLSSEALRRSSRAATLRFATPRAPLQEWSLARGLGLPTYTIVTQTGTAHAPAFTIAVEVQGRVPRRKARAGRNVSPSRTPPTRSCLAKVWKLAHDG